MALPVFAAWTLLVWATRIDNIWSDAALATGGKVGRTALAGSFVLAAVAVGAVALRIRRHRVRPADRLLVGGALGWTVGVWAVRSAGIVAGDHDTAFVVVHLALAVISVALGWWAWRAVAPARASAPEIA